MAISSYLVIARRYRPQKFSEVIGQNAIVRTLKNSLKKKSSAHAYLFAGARGTGKTTLARLFAKALNCSHLTADFEPCGLCSNCQEIIQGRSLDVIEIDGASNRGIDDIRQINETIGYAPTGNYKIYIIDEVHMLTKEAFGALLKTLEEPPERIKFFFATTEPHKMLSTILSRCQRFDLQRIPSALIVEKLFLILSDLKREADREAVEKIALFSEGSLRDAESLLDQMLCSTESKLTTEAVHQILGLIPTEIFFSLDEAISQRKLSFAYELVETLLSQGKNLSHFLQQLSDHFRNLLFLKIERTWDGFSETLQRKYEVSLPLYSVEQLLYILERIAKSMNFNFLPRVHLESLLVEILESRLWIPLSSLVLRLEDLEKKISSSYEPDPLLPQKEEKPIELEKISFSLNAAVPLPKPIEKKTSPLSKTHLDTLLQFTAVELEGTLEKESP